jgi:hypothetical protein
LKTTLLFFLCSIISSFGQFRIVHGGQVYSIYDASAWVPFGTLEVSTVMPQGILCRVVIDKTITSTLVSHPGTAFRSSETSRTFRTYGQTIFLMDYHSPYALVPGSIFGPVQAVLVNVEPLSRNYSVYDVGAPYTPPVVPLTPEQKAALAKKKHHEAVKVFRWLENQATNGSVSAQTSLGEHYLTGNGTDTNLVLGKYWLQKAADSGDVEASNKLVSLSQTNRVVSDDDK